MESFSKAQAEQATESGSALIEPARAGDVRVAGSPVDHEFIWGTIALGMLAAAALPEAALSQAPFFFCPFRTMTGLPCPFCGGTHAMQAFVRGHWALAWQYNPLAVAIGLAAAGYIAYAAVAVVANRRWRPHLERPRRWTAGLTLAATTAGIANWIWLIHLARAGLWK